MNKKFSTLVAGAALLLGAVSANAQFTHVDLQGATAVDKLQTKDGAYADNGLYQLANDDADSVLYMNDAGKLLMVPAPTQSDSLANSLWCVSVVDPAVQGSTYKWDFINKGTGQRLDITMEGNIAGAVGSIPLVTANDTVVAGGEIAGWAFAGNYKETLAQKNYLYSYFSTDSVVGLSVTAGSGTNPGGVFLVKEAASKAMDKTNKSFKEFTLYKASEIILSAKEINTIFGTYEKEDHGVKLKFNRDINKTDLENPFNTKAFFAEQVREISDNGSATAASDTLKYVYVLRSDSSYLKVDTAYTNNDESNAKFLAYKWSKLDKDSRKYAVNATPQDSLKKSEMKAQYQFLFTYRPSVDSLNIYVNQATFHKAGKAATAKDFANDTTHFANARVSLQTLVSGDDTPRILTVDSLNQNTHIYLEWAGCTPVASDKTSKDNGLYVIYNAKGEVLASPIHYNGAKYEWVDPADQDPEHMPAYQWLVIKTQNSASLKETSPIKLINREYGDAYGQSGNIQLYLKDGKLVSDKFEITNTTGVNNEFASMTGLNFAQITDSTIIKDTVLGYKYIRPIDLQVTKYQFNYFNPFNQNKWVAKGEGKDSVLYVKDDKDPFTLHEGNYTEYGVKVTNTILSKIPGLAQLHRMQYVVALKGDTLLPAAQNKYAVGKVNIADADSFYFKENNHYDGKHYYAIVEAWNGGANMDSIKNNAQKVGVTDDAMSAALKVQTLGETRTSSFTVEKYDTPLYRRFNRAVLGESVTDGRDSLRFFENVRKEYLMDENNREGGLMDANVNYLGMWTANKATGLAFQVDTAWVTRGNGDIKPQYLVSVAHKDFEGTPGKPCTEEGPHVDKDGNITDADHCVHATPAIPGFERAKYLVSFQDSVDVYGQDKPYADIAGGYTRVGFVEGIRVADTLWILPAEFKALANNKIDFDALNKANKALTDAGELGFKNLLTGDEHKNYTWSFRYVTPNDALGTTTEAPENSFLFESNNYDGENIAPENAAWLKIQNGCVVLTDDKSTFSNAKTGGDGALVFNVDNKDNDELATDNEAISTSEVTVIAQNGAVRIANAEGKKVVITNILGQTVANTVITSSDATIAAPAGVVVVAVEGEEAVKAIVK
ncbi:DUF6383 domain-containing protein [uncultured Parabacteroides sp.]|uniref:DUF6383 domain-containing protein n=1 Tax=uncultured Parabacteroides sp. TaxID=512312 RepID=UPI0025FAAC67|nr:DUF6383 domain-containing protein [uncultured Parabacteroides sp.]